MKGTAQEQENHLTGGAAPVTQHRLVPFSRPTTRKLMDEKVEIFPWNASMCLNGAKDRVAVIIVWSAAVECAIRRLHFLLRRTLFGATKGVGCDGWPEGCDCSRQRRRAAAALLRYPMRMLGPLECCHLHCAKVETAISLSSFFTFKSWPVFLGPYKSLADTRCQALV